MRWRGRGLQIENPSLPYTYVHNKQNLDYFPSSFTDGTTHFFARSFASSVSLSLSLSFADA